MASDAMPGSGYFLYHSIGMFPGKAQRVAEALARAATLWGTPDDAQWERSLAIRAEFLAHWRRLIDAPAGTLTTAENVTTAAHSVIGSLPERLLRGRKLLITADCFPSLHFLLAGMGRRHGFELHTVPIRPGEHWVRDDDLLAHWTRDVGVALLTWVTSTASHRCDLRRLIEHGRSMGSVVGVDITQGVGIIPFSVPEVCADFVIATSLKWLCGVPGAGILHVREPLLRECQPELRGWFSQENIFSWSLDSFTYARDARRFDHGTPSILPYVACLPALEWIGAQDPVALLAHNRRLSELLADAGTALGLALVSPRRADERGGSLMFQLPAASDPAGLVDALRGRGMYTDCRARVLRLSPGNMTTEDGATRLMRALRMSLEKWR